MAVPEHTLLSLGVIDTEVATGETTFNIILFELAYDVVRQTAFDVIVTETVSLSKKVVAV